MVHQWLQGIELVCVWEEKQPSLQGVMRARPQLLLTVKDVFVSFARETRSLFISAHPDENELGRQLGALLLELKKRTWSAEEWSRVWDTCEDDVQDDLKELCPDLE